MINEKEMRDKAQALLDAAYDYWQTCVKNGQHGAVQWLDDVSGRTVIFTRGEYRATLMKNIDQLRFEGAKLHSFNMDTAPQHGIEAATDSDLRDDTAVDV